MGILEKNAEKAHDRQKQSLIAEAAKAGCEVRSVDEAGVGGGAGVLEGALKSIVGGRMNIDHVQTLTLETNGRTHLYFQPYAGVAAMPGEHYAIVDGALPVAVAFENGIFSNGWSSPDDKAVAKALNGNGALKKVAKKSKFEWAVGMTKIELEWAAQIVGLGDGRSELVLQTGRYGGFTTYEVGFKHFVALWDAVAGALDTGSAAKHAPIHPPAYDLLFRQLLLGETGAPAEAPPVVEASPYGDIPVASGQDYAGIVRNAASEHEGKKIHVSELPAKKDKNIRTVVLPAGAQQEEIVAAFDLTMFGSGKDAVVFTPTHCYAHEMDDRVSFALSDLVGVDGWDGALHSNVVVQIRNIGATKVPGAGEDALVETLEAVARANA